MNTSKCILRVNSPAQMQRIVECAERFGIAVKFTDEIPKTLLPKDIPYLGYIFLIAKDSEDILKFAKYAESIDKIANFWTLPTQDAK